MEEYCRTNHGDLAITKNIDDMVQLQNEAQIQQFISKAWVGLYDDINSRCWSVGNEMLLITKWAAGEPNNSGGHQECGAIPPKY